MTLSILIKQARPLTSHAVEMSTSKKQIQKKFAPRRSHNKSRSGCGNCKRRRVKCDEEKPSCVNCKKHGVSCDFATVATSPSQSSQVSSEVPTPTSESAEPTTNTFQELLLHAGALSTSDQIPPDGPITFADFELLHHFCTSACYTLSESLDGHNFWRLTVPQIGFSHHFVLHLVLAFSALHIGHSRPQQRESYLFKAEHHHTIGVQQVTALLPHVDAKNCAAVYLAGVLVCFYNFARGPRPGEYITFTEDDTPGEWLVLLRGVKAIITSMDGSFWKIMEPIMNKDAQKVQKVPVRRIYRPMYEQPLQELQQHIESFSKTSRDPIALIYTETLESLMQSFKKVYRSDESCGHIIFAWLYCLSDGYMRCLQSRDATALLIFAHYIVLMRELECFWFLDGWTTHVINGICRFLPEDYHKHLQWPLREISSGGTKNK